MRILYIIVVFMVLLAGLISIESDRRAYALRTCVGNVTLNGDGYTLDKEDIDLCTKAYDRRTSRNYELQNAIKRPVIDKKATLL